MSQILVSPEGQEAGVYGAVKGASGRVVATVGGTVSFHPLENRRPRRFPRFTRKVRPAPGQTSQVDEIEIASVAERSQVIEGTARRDVLAERREAFEAEYRVIEIAVSAAISKTAVFVDLALQEAEGQARGVTELFPRQSRDLQHF